ncbi:sensor domain-containing diguanylate cyclase [Uliginosibacterium sp. H3]|uniref:diguanylate cyclase n=1 Tax=Uliginosibacterium silvisoli TaxID=3114758 RepID=A0ABU6JYZ2_9RHOO|nr:sensor domain-containing diguanylate cyclase [Uliginosibacterium sp. H3]
MTNGAEGQRKASGKRRLIVQLSALLALGFVLTSVISYVVSRREIHVAIVERELPLTSDNIYSEIQKDLIRPIFISSMMASDTFLRDWALDGEKNLPALTKYLSEVRTRYGTFSSFFISERTHSYYHADGMLRAVSESDPRDAWYFRARAMRDPYEVNIDLDTRTPETMAVFINYRMFDYANQFIGLTGVGLTVDTVRRLLLDYRQRYQRSVYFVDRQGKVMLFGTDPVHGVQSIQEVEGLRDMAAQILGNAATNSASHSYQYRSKGHDYLLNVRYMPEMKWFLFVEKREDAALSGIRRTLVINLVVCGLILAGVLWLTSMTLNRYQLRLEDMATTDRLSGLFNRHAFDVLIQQALAEHRRNERPLCALLIDIDHFKAVNDRHGHLSGDRMIAHVAGLIRSNLRESDIACRWGGEEFLLLLRDCSLAHALVIADKLREQVIEQPLADAAGDIHVTVSAGISELRDEDTPETLVERADRALYAAKRAGRNCVESA